ncbi:hypothetical protein ElyMa_006944800 [Elysia marginata]|uniref:Uncharacterized protein n=1 Tax=Elysia marginata TaxID=1093978 RepID=A0AAV4JL00_9GAST|nr:hypothetical protein ElyMa_006944800 [Elysia marginata]
MGNSSSKRPSNSKPAAQEDNQAKPVKTETQLDSIEITELILPVRGKQLHVNLGLVNTVEEEIERLIADYSLNIRLEDCEMVIIKDNGDRRVMEFEHEVERYKDSLVISSNIVQLVHNPKSSNTQAPNLGSLGIALK